MPTTEDLLNQVNDILIKHDKERAERLKRGEEFNIFLALGIEAKEVLNCRFIAELINPSGSHGQGNIYLKLFVENVLTLNADDDEWNHAAISTEHSAINKRRIDIVICTPKHFVALEFKIYGGEQENQCQDYYQTAVNSRKTPLLYYITRFGEMPSKFSLGTLSKDKVNCRSFNIDIVKWIEACIANTDKNALVYTVLCQFLSSIKSITNQSEDLNMEIYELLKSNKDYLKSAMILIRDTADKFTKPSAIRKIRQEILTKIFEGVESKITEETPFYSNYKKAIEGFFSGRLSYLYKRIDNTDLYVLVTLLNDCTYFRLGQEWIELKNDTPNFKTKFEDVSGSISDLLINFHSGSDNWLRPYDCNFDGESPDFDHMNDACIKLCTDEDKMNQFIDYCAERIKELLKI